MTYKELLYAVTVYDTGSISAAAKNLYISQSALSQSMHKLEDELGITLFMRSGIHMVPTRGFTFFVERGREVLRVWSQFEAEMQVYTQRQQSALSVAMDATFFKNLLPYVLPELERKNRDFEVDFLEERSNTVEELVMRNAVDLGIVREPVHLLSIASERLFSTELLLAVPREHPFCRKHPFRGLDQLEAVNLAELKNELFSLVKHQRITHLWKPLFETAEFEPLIYRYSSVWENVRDYVKHSFSLALIDEMIVRHDPGEDRICYYRIANCSTARGVMLVYHPGRRFSGQEHAFVDILKRYHNLVNGPIG